MSVTPSAGVRLLALALGGALTLGGCGFQLRGQTPLPPQFSPLYVDYRQPLADPAGPFATTLTRALRANGVALAADPATAASRLQLLDLDYRRRTLATGSAGAVREYRIGYRVTFALVDAAGRPLSGPHTVDVERDILYDETEVLSAVAGENITRTQLAEDAAAALLRRLRTR